MKRGIGVRLAAVCVLAALGISIFALGSASASAAGRRGVAAGHGVKHHSKKHCVVPKLKRDSLTAAKKALKHAHCALGKVKSKPSHRIPKGEVISSKPRKGTSHKAGTKVRLTVSSGKTGGPISKQACTVPQVIGDTVPAAKKALKKAHCKLGKVTNKPSPFFPKGQVSSSKPRAGQKLKPGGKVALTVSTGPKSGPPATCVVPNVVGQPLAAAESALTAAHCPIGTTKQKPSKTVPQGDVISTSPKAGKPLKAGKHVNLVVSTGPKAYPVPKP